MTKFINELNYDKKPYDSFDKNPAKIGYVNDLAEYVDAQIAAIPTPVTNPIVKVEFNGVNVTATTAPTITKSFLISASEIPANGVIDFFSAITRTNTTGTCMITLYLNTEDSFTGATAIGQSQIAAGGVYGAIERHFKVDGVDFLNIYPTSTYASDTVASMSLAYATNTIDPTVDLYLIVSLTNSSATGESAFSHGRIAIYS